VFLGLLDPDPDLLVRGMDSDTDLLVRGMDSAPDPYLLLSSCKNCKKNLDSYCFCDYFCLFIFEKLCKCTFKKYEAEKIVLN